MSRTDQVPRRARSARVRITALALAGALLCSGGCGQLVRDIALAPIKVAETVAVETTKLPYRVAEQSAAAVLDAMFKKR